MSKTKQTMLIVGGVLATLSLCCVSCIIAGTMVDAGQVPGSITNATGLDGTYSCAVPGRSSPLGTTTPAVTLDMALTISGNSYEGSGGGGSVALNETTVSFSGGAYDGWLGLLDTSWGNTNIVFAQNKQTLPEPNAPGAIRCTRRKD